MQRRYWDTRSLSEQLSDREVLKPLPSATSVASEWSRSWRSSYETHNFILILFKGNQMKANQSPSSALGNFTPGLTLVKQHFDWSLEDWSNVLSTYEPYFRFHHDSHWVRECGVWSLDSERIRSPQGVHLYRGDSTMVQVDCCVEELISFSRTGS